MYNITDDSNTITIEESDNQTQYTIANGNYTAEGLKTELNSAVTASGFSVNFNDEENIKNCQYNYGTSIRITKSIAQR